MVTRNYDYGSVLADSLKVAWRVEDLIGGDKRLDFTRAFLPDALAGVREIACLTAREKLLLNQIRGNSYLYLFGFVEEFILPFVLDQARAAVHGDALEVRALTTFAGEEAKHIHLFQRFAEEFRAGFGHPCGVIGPASAVAGIVLSHGALGVALLVLHFEWMSHAHYVESVKSDEALDPLFKSLLRHHWMEEAQHARLDTLLVDKLGRAAGAAGITQAFADFATFCAAIDALLGKQAKLDVASLERASGRAFNAAERADILAAQGRSYRETFLVSGMRHPNVVRAMNDLDPAGADRVAQAAAALS